MTSATAPTAVDLDLLSINTIRTLSMDAVQKANSGHPGTPMALAPLAYLLYTKIMRHSPKHPHWHDRDRFVLSAGHASMLLYSSLYLTGYDLTLDDLKNFRQWASPTPGHPEHGHAPGVETTTGPLGQGFANGVGMAIAEAHLAARFNRPGHEIIDHFVYAICSDGDLMEGVSHEAASLAGHLKLGKLIYFWDDNRITIEGSTDLAFSEDIRKRFESYGWQVLRVDDGNDLKWLRRAISAAQRNRDKPTMIITRTHIGYGAPTKQDTAAAHGAPLGKDEIAGAKKFYGWPTDEPFHVPEEALAHCRKAQSRGARAERDWRKRWDAYAAAYPAEARELELALSGDLPEGWDSALPQFTAQDGAMATRAASGKVLNAIAPRLPMLIGGSADLAESNNTHIKGSGDFAAGQYAERNMHFGIREHAMGGVMNGMSLHGGVRPYGGTFLVFSDYCRPSIRLAALSGMRPIYIFTHDSIGLGEDGPTHQPIEHLAALRAIPNILVIRPADGAETAEAWRVALENRLGPSLLVLTRQKTALIDREQFARADGTRRGAYVLAEASGGAPRVILIGTGSEVGICLAARELLEQQGVPARVVSMPCVELFRRQDDGYREQVLPRAVRARVAVEAAAPFGWREWVGDQGAIVGIETFGASAPYERIYQEFGLTPENVAATARRLHGDV